MGSLLSKYFELEADEKAKKREFESFLKGLATEVEELNNDMKVARCEGSCWTTESEQVLQFNVSRKGDCPHMFSVYYDRNENSLILSEFPDRVFDLKDSQIFDSKGMKAISGSLARVLIGELSNSDKERLREANQKELTNQSPVVG